MSDVVVVNERDEVVGTMPKALAHENGTPHRIVVVFVGNGRGEFLVQERVDGLLDHSAAGHVDPGETYEDAAKRELFEELGIRDVVLTRIGHGSTENETYEGHKGFRRHVFDIFTCVGEPARLQPEEVQSVYWAKPEDVLADMEQRPERYCLAFRVALPIYVASVREA